MEPQKSIVITVIVRTSILLSKKLKNNEIRYFKTNSTYDAKPWKRYRMHQNPPLAGIKRHARTLGSDVSLLGAHMSGAEFQYPDNKWLEMCGQMANRCRVGL